MIFAAASASRHASPVMWGSSENSLDSASRVPTNAVPLDFDTPRPLPRIVGFFIRRHQSGATSWLLWRNAAPGNLA
jgi:hypothetical protein